jgi:glutathionyl-hydroquinone reductase
MGQLIEGIWHDQWYDTSKTKGRFVRAQSQFRKTIGPQGDFRPQAGRYHLYVSLACPWAHRTLIFRKIKGLDQLIGLTVVHPDMLENGWTFGAEDPDPIAGHGFLHQVYTSAAPDYSGRVTVPVLWDKQNRTIVNNESSEIIRMFNSAFGGLTGNDLDFYPHALRPVIDEWNDYIYPRINNGVYRAGFATRQSAYEEAYADIFEALDRIEYHLETNRYLAGATLTEADWRLFTTLIRFDAVYHGHFKANRQRIEDYRNISHYLRDLYQYKGVAETVDFAHIKRHYYVSQTSINPTQIVPSGPVLDFTRPHDRAEKFG